MQTHETVLMGCSRNSSSATNRRPSMLSAETGRLSGGMHDTRTNGTEIDRLRNKIQRAIIEDTGPTSVQLWAGALKMLVYGRAVLLGGVSSPCLLTTTSGSRRSC